jgi:hypothetical protein
MKSVSVDRRVHPVFPEPTWYTFDTPPACISAWVKSDHELTYAGACSVTHHDYQLNTFGICRISLRGLRDSLS